MTLDYMLEDETIAKNSKLMGDGMHIHEQHEKLVDILLLVVKSGT